LSRTPLLLGFDRLFRRRRAAAEGQAADSGRLFDDPDQVNLLAITRGAEEEESLRRIADSLHWDVSIAGSSAEAIQLLRDRPMPLVICDRDLPGEDWRATVAEIAARRDVLCVVLASRVIDDYLWDEVIKQRGYDVVSKPFEADQLRRAVTFAWSWKRWYMRSLRPISIG
jgi:DNA-binding NtrC family response regulator